MLVGRCWEAGGAPAYWPWVQALRAYVARRERRGAAQLGAGAADLAAAAARARRARPDLPAPALDSDGARFRLFEAVGAFLRRAAEARPLVLVLDDLHAADEPSLLLLRFVAREIAGSRLLIVGAYRDVDPTLSEPLTAALAELVREPHSVPDRARRAERARRRRVHRARDAATRPADELVAAIHAETEGNPLFVAEVVRLLDAEGRLGDAGRRAAHPAGRPRGRSASAWGGCRRPAASCSSPRPCWAASSGSTRWPSSPGSTARRPARRARRGARERVVGDVPGSPGRLRFGHALIRDTLYDELAARAPAAAARARRRGARGRLRRRPRAAPRRAGAPLRRRRPGGLRRARRSTTRAAPATARARQLAYEEAVRHYEIALTLVDRRRDALRAAARARRRPRAGRRPRGPRRRSYEAAELAERPGCPSSSAAPRSATAGGSSGTSRATTRASCRCSSGPSPRSARPTARCASGCSPGSPAARCATRASRPSAGAA